MNEADNQVRAAHKILGFDPIQRSFLAPKHVIRAKDPWLHKINVVEHGFLIPEGSPVPEDIPLAGTSSSPKVVEAEGGVPGEEEVADSGPSEDEFDVFNQFHSSEDPLGDLGDPNLAEADFLSEEASPQLKMSFKRRPQTSLLALIEGQPGKDALGKSPPKLPPPPPQQSSPSGSKPTNPKQKKDKGKWPRGDEESDPSQDDDDARRPSKQLRAGHRGQDKQTTVQPGAQAWLLAPTLHRKPLMDDAFLRDPQGGEGAHVADALGRSLLLPTDMAQLEVLGARMSSSASNTVWAW